MKDRPSRKLPRCQIIGVDCAQLQMNSARNAWRNETGDGASLVAGYYLEIWPAGAIPSSNRRAPRYLGPHTTAAARMLQITAVSLGIVEPMPRSAIHATPCYQAEGRGFAPTVDAGAKPLASLPFALCANGR
ncbi:MAG: hypothetical protein IPK39_13395 [Sulfuritalea sp.]|nr:hypothetical protein [Sulfuritalea sp.]